MSTESVVPVDPSPGGETLSVLVVTYNSESHIGGCLRALYALQPTFEVLVWDNGSSDGTRDAVHRAWPGLGIRMFDSENIGFARAVNALSREATGRYLLLLNPDCRVEPDALGRLIATLRANSALGAIGPAVSSHEGARHAGGGWQPSIPRLLVEIVGLPSVLPLLFGRMGIWARLKSVQASEDELYSVDWVSGTCLLVDAKAMRAVDGLSEQWFMYCEDMDLGSRLSNLGLQSALVPRVTVTHVGGASHGSGSGTRSMQVTSLLSYYSGRNRRLVRLRRSAFKRLLQLYLIERWLLLPQSRSQYTSLIAALEAE